jgi:hypothetical protein
MLNYDKEIQMENTIQTVKKQVNENNELVGYLVDGTKSVPLAEGNRDYQEVQKYIEDGGIVEEAYTKEELEAIELAKVKSEAQAYLDSTDWYYARLAETGEEVPAEVVSKRKESRNMLRSDKEGE